MLLIAPAWEAGWGPITGMAAARDRLLDAERDPARGGVLPHQELGDEVPGEGEEEGHPEEPAAEARDLGVEPEDEHERGAAEPVERGLMG